ncbi:MAG: carbohydrate-binding protein [Candidatus Hydrogenedentes bacterium]|nr:carbohydrate-binding protein [Candidatus Hydrogenedentota bacterium]
MSVCCRCFCYVTVFFVLGTIAYADRSVPKPTPYKGVVQTIPGVVEAEHYDEGPAGVAYFDVDEKNHGVDYREDTQVDIEKRPDASNGHGIGWIREKEWVLYTVEVKNAGVYRLEIPVASNKAGGTFHIEFDGKDVTGPLTIPDTGGWDTLKTIKKKGITLKAGKQMMKIVMDKDGESGGIGDIDLVRFVEAKKTE